MATATFSMLIRYLDEDAVNQVKVDEVACTYTACNRGIVDIPAGTVSTTVFTIPVGSLAKVTGLRITNRSLQRLTLKINGSNALQGIAAGGTVFLADPSWSATPITAVTLTATATEVAAATIAYASFGDNT